MQNALKIWAKYSSVFLNGLGTTLWMSAVIVLCGTVLGILLALMRMGRFKPLRIVADIYVEIIRGLPALVQLYFFWILLPKAFGLSDLLSILIALVLNATAYISEIIRAGIQAVDKGQWEAARSIGLSERHVLTKIILPQAIKNILPALCNEFITTIKGTSLASVFFVGELTTSYKIVTSATFLALESLCISGAIYLVLNVILSKCVALLERRMAVSER